MHSFYANIVRRNTCILGWLGTMINHSIKSLAVKPASYEVMAAEGVIRIQDNLQDLGHLHTLHPYFKKTCLVHSVQNLSTYSVKTCENMNCIRRLRLKNGLIPGETARTCNSSLRTLMMKSLSSWQRTDGVWPSNICSTPPSLWKICQHIYSVTPQDHENSWLGESIAILNTWTLLYTDLQTRHWAKADWMTIQFEFFDYLISFFTSHARKFQS